MRYNIDIPMNITAESLQVTEVSQQALPGGKVRVFLALEGNIPRPDHPEAGQVGWFTKQGDPIEILGWDEDTATCWVRFPKPGPRGIHSTSKTYVYDRLRWDRYWQWDPTRVVLRDSVFGDFAKATGFEDDDDDA